jgi:hypothetical protein
MFTTTIDKGSAREPIKILQKKNGGKNELPGVVMTDTISVLAAGCSKNIS